MSRLAMAWGIVFFAVPLVGMAEEPSEADRRAAAEFFEKQIRPLLIQRCDECHSTEKADESGHLALDNRAALLAGGSRGPTVVAGKPDDSLLIKAVRYLDPDLQMPPDGKLAAAEVEILSKWVRDGAFVPDYGKDQIKKSKGIDWKKARHFWSFQSAQRPGLPHGATVAGRNPVDAFIASGLRSHDLAMSPEADRRTLIRRLSFDLLGLPPAIDDVEAFVGDERPDAYERLVDRLLASPHVGERWGRYWLDLARYVDATPDWQKNTDRAWMYRDWVVRAINEDRPYDDFVRNQLAADLIPDADPHDRAALGFLGVSPTYWKELKLAPSVIEVIVADEWDERLDTVSRTFLGLTVACARCHDHKFDPVTARDYYALAGVFASTQVADRPLLPSPLAERVADAQLQVGKLQETLKKQKDKESDEARKLQQQIDEIRSATPQIDALLAPVVEESSVYVVADGPDATRLEYRKQQPRDLPVFRRGNPGNPGEIVPRRFLQLFADPSADDNAAGPPGDNRSGSTESAAKGLFRQGSGRLELADAILNDAGPLTARVIINRIWTHHFGKGLVRTPGDFGQQGERPSHPELLEWLVSELLGLPDNPSAATLKRPPRWSLKRLHRLLVTSATYRQSSSGSGMAAKSMDADNQWLGRMNRRRLEVEPWRDAMLAVADQLDDRMHGPGMDLDQAVHCRRTLYSRVGRDEQNDMLRIYDFPPPTTHSPARDVTTTPLQQLFVLNSDFIDRQSARLAARLLEPPDASVAQRVERCYRWMFQRSPRSDEVRLAERFVADAAASNAKDLDCWRWYIQSLFGLNEFQFID